jgi:hypothetical protein
MLKTTFKISIAVALLTVGSMANGQGNGKGNGNQETATQETQEVTTQERGHGKGKGHHASKNSQNEESSSSENGNGKSKGNKESEEPSLPTLTDADKAGIIYIVEEEKVARDVYRHLAESWDTDIFSKIADSEQKHVDAVSKLVSKYDVELPMTMDEEGIFTSEKLQDMYDALVAQGDKSLEEALKVGVEIEETDIEDLEELLDGELEEDVEKVYSRILRGSYNHLRSFNRQLDK